jgi:hypothetical protein
MHRCVAGEALDQAGEQLALEGYLRGDHAHVPALALLDGGFDGRLHAHDRHIKSRAQMAESCGRGRISGDDNHAGTMLHEEASDGLGECLDMLECPVAVGDVRRVGKVEDLLMGRLPCDLTQHREATDARIKDADAPRA